MITTVSRYAKQAALALAIALVALMPASAAHAQTYSTAQLQAQVALLMQQVALMQAQLPASVGSYSSTYHYADDCSYDRYCDTYRSTSYRSGDIDEIEVDFVGRVAQVRINYFGRDDRRYALYADSVREVAEALSRELGLSVLTIERLIDVTDFDDDDYEDIRSIDVDFSGDDAHVLVRFRDGDTDRFTLRNVDRDEDEVIEEIADRYDERESRIEHLVDFDFDGNDIRDIDVDFFSDDAEITVRFYDGDTDRFVLREVDEDEDDVIRYLARRYDESKSFIEDIADFH